MGNEAREYLFKECDKNKENRFLSFFTLRYGVNFVLGSSSKYGIAKRRFWESELFGFEYNANNAYKLSMGIFQILNFKYKPRNVDDNRDFISNFKKAYPHQTHLDWILKYENDFLYAKKIKEQTWQEFYNQDAKANNLYTRLQNIQGITPSKDNFLSPYLTYLNTLTQKTFTLENIYCIKNFFWRLRSNET